MPPPTFPIETVAIGLAIYLPAMVAGIRRAVRPFPPLEAYRRQPWQPSAVAQRVLGDRLTPPRTAQDPRALEVQRMADAHSLDLAPPPFQPRRPALPGRTLIPDESTLDA